MDSQDNNLPLITEENYSKELSTLGYSIGDPFPFPPILGEEDYKVDEAFLELNPDLRGDENFALGTVIKRPIIGDIPPKEAVVPEAPTQPEAPVVPETVVPTDVTPDVVPEAAIVPDVVPEAVPENVVVTSEGPVKTYEGRRVVSEGKRMVNDIEYNTIRIEDGSTYDLTNEQYALEVVLKEL